MTNPARLLLNWFEEHTGKANESVARERGLETDERKVWADLRQAMGLLNQIESILGGLSAAGRDVAPYQAALPRWSAAVVVPGDWVHISSAAGLSREDSGLLQLLAANLDDLGLYQVLNSSQLDELRKMLRSAGDLLRESPGTDLAFRMHLFELLSLADRAVKEYMTLGTFNLQAAIERLAVAFQLKAFMEQDKTKREKWVGYAKKALVLVGVPLAVHFGDVLIDSAIDAPQPSNVIETSSPSRSETK